MAYAVPPINGGAQRYQQGRIDYDTFCQEFQELSWMDGKRTPLDGKQLRRYIASMQEVVETYKMLIFDEKLQKELKGLDY